MVIFEGENYWGFIQLDRLSPFRESCIVYGGTIQFINRGGELEIYPNLLLLAHQKDVSIKVARH